jgi:hypothetical protein
MPARWAIGENRRKSKVLSTNPEVNAPNNPEIGLPAGFSAVRAKDFFIPVQNKLYKYLSKGVAKARSRLYYTTANFPEAVFRTFICAQSPGYHALLPKRGKHCKSRSVIFRCEKAIAHLLSFEDVSSSSFGNVVYSNTDVRLSDR